MDNLNFFFNDNNFYLHALLDSTFTVLNATNISYNTHNTKHNYIYIVNNTYYTYNTKITYILSIKKEKKKERKIHFFESRQEIDCK